MHYFIKYISLKLKKYLKKWEMKIQIPILMVQILMI